MLQNNKEVKRNKLKSRLNEKMERGYDYLPVMEVQRDAVRLEGIRVGVSSIKQLQGGTWEI
jgi:hypothetical protein